MYNPAFCYHLPPQSRNHIPHAQGFIAILSIDKISEENYTQVPTHEITLKTNIRWVGENEEDERRALEPLGSMVVAGALFGLNKELHQWLKDKHPTVAYGVICTTGGVMGGDTQIFLEQASRLFFNQTTHAG